MPGDRQPYSATAAAKVSFFAEQLLDRVLPAWQPDDRSSKVRRRDHWNRLRDWVGLGTADPREQELRAKLGDNAPSVSAGHLHPLVWSGVRSLWQSGYYSSAVEDAAKKRNAGKQNKVGRRDIDVTELFEQAFSHDAPAHGKARPRCGKPDDTDTYKLVQRGAWALLEGVYAGIRNRFNHEDPRDLDEQSAQEYLAALSVLARWVDDAEVETAP